MLTLKLFGAASIETSTGPISGRAAQGRRLALLAFLSLARGRPVTRDKVIALLWPESTTDRARAQLSDDLYILRSALGDDVIRSNGDELALNPDAIASDAATSERLLDQGRLEAAVDLFAGPLLDGFHVPDAAELDRWLDAERTRLEHRYAAALESLAEASESRGDPAAAAQAVQWWRKLAARDPANGRVAMRLMRALDATGDRAGALRHARVHAALLREEFDAEPDAEVTAFAERLRRESGARPAPDVVSARPATLPPNRNVDASPEAESNLPSLTSSSGAPPERRRWRRPLGYGVAAALLVAVTVIAVRGVDSVRPAARPSASSVGVMPFVNMSQEPGDAYLGDGLTEQIITTLSRIEGLRVAARTSSFALRNGNLDVRAIGDTLGVAAVLEGSLRRDGDRLRITAQLIDAATGYHLWAEDYDRDLKDILTMQDEIASAIAGALELRLARAGTPAPARAMPELETYDLYLRGLHLRNTLRADALQESIGLLDRAIARQPAYAPAYAAKATVIGPQVMFGYVAQEKGVEELRAVTTRALELDPSLSEAHAALGMLELFFDWNWTGAEQALRRAIQLNPNDAQAYHHLANCMRVMGRLDEAIAARSRAIELDPLNARTTVILGNDYLAAGEMDRALAAYRRALQLDPVNALALGTGPFHSSGPALVYQAQGRDREAVEEYLRIATLRGATTAELDALRADYARSGWSGFWRSWLTMVLRQSEDRPDALQVAGLWALIGDSARALDWLDRAWRSRHPGLVYLRSDTRFESVRAHPRFARVVIDMKLP